MNLQNLGYALLAMAVGSLLPIQTAANAQLAKMVGGPIAATMVSFTISWFALLALDAALFRQCPSFAGIAAAPIPLLLIAGVVGVIFFSVNVFIAPKIGAAALSCLLIAGQLGAALIIDRLGLFAFAVRELSLGRVVGVTLVLAGATLASRS